MWTEKVTWFSNDVGKKGQIAVGQLADVIVPDRDYFACAEDDIAGASSLLTIVGGKVVYATGEFSALDDNPPPPAMPDWSPVRKYGGFAAWKQGTSPALRCSRLQQLDADVHGAAVCMVMTTAARGWLRRHA
jgi:hypothetical protein